MYRNISFQLLLLVLIGAAVNSCKKKKKNNNPSPPPQPAAKLDIPPPIECGKSSSGKAFAKITGGREVSIGRWPWMVSIRYKENNWKHHCGGVLVNAFWIATATQCFRRATTNRPIPLKDFRFIVGASQTDNRDGNEQTKNPKFKIEYPGYVGVALIGYLNDLTLVRLVNPVKFNDFVRPICLPEINEAIPDNAICLVSGYGQTKGWTLGDQNSPSQRLKETRVKVEKNETCKRSYNHYNGTQHLCSANVQGNQGACFGDVGGPLQCNINGKWKLFGIVSLVSGCGLSNFPVVYTRVPHYITFIRQNTGQVRCGLPSVNVNIKAQSRIIGGTNAQRRAWPWHVGVWYLPSSRHYCGAVLIGDVWVISAAHCYVTSMGDKIPPTNFEFVFGAYNLPTATYPAKTQRRNATQIFIHRDYQNNLAEDLKASIHNDIAVIKLSKPLEMTTDIRPVCIARSTDEMTPNTTCVTTGWGVTQSGGTKPNGVLAQVVLPLVEHESCFKQFNVNRYQVNKNEHICAGAAGKDTCTGDSGGPLVCKRSLTGQWALQGITSWGIGCGRFPGIYARVFTYTSWIKKITGID